MGTIFENEEPDKDTVSFPELSSLFTRQYSLLTENTLHHKKCYINKLALTKSLKLAITLSNDQIEVFELTSSSLKRIVGLSGHNKTLTDVVFSPKEDHLLYTSSHDGVIKLWDTRTSGSCVQEYKDEDDITRPLESMDVSRNGRLICAGSQLVQDDAYLVFWDSRQPVPLGGYWNSHQDDVTQVKFHKTKNEIVATGGNDSLINIFNIMEQSEDDALIYSLNTENSVEKLTWLDDELVSCITQCSDVQLWNTNTGDMTKSYERDKISKGIKRSKGDDCYAVDVYTRADNTHTLLAGSNAGDGDILRSVELNNKKLQPSTCFYENKQIVRCCAYNPERDFLVTAGESGLINVWKYGTADAPTCNSNKITSKKSHLHAMRHNPY